MNYSNSKVDKKVKFYPQGVQVCRDESFSHTGKKHLLSAFSASRRSARDWAREYLELRVVGLLSNP